MWCAEFDRKDDGDRQEPLALRDITNKRRGDKRVKEEKVRRVFKFVFNDIDISFCKFLEGSMTLKPIVHEIRIQNQVIFLDPPIEYARQTWITQLHDWLGM